MQSQSQMEVSMFLCKEFLFSIATKHKEEDTTEITSNHIF